MSKPHHTIPAKPSTEQHRPQPDVPTPKEAAKTIAETVEPVPAVSIHTALLESVLAVNYGLTIADQSEEQLARRAELKVILQAAAKDGYVTTGKFLAMGDTTPQPEPQEKSKAEAKADAKADAKAAHKADA